MISVWVFILNADQNNVFVARSERGNSAFHTFFTIFLMFHWDEIKI